MKFPCLHSFRFSDFSDFPDFQVTHFHTPVSPHCRLPRVCFHEGAVDCIHRGMTLACLGETMLSPSRSEFYCCGRLPRKHVYQVKHTYHRIHADIFHHRHWNIYQDCLRVEASKSVCLQHSILDKEAFFITQTAHAFGS